MVSSVRISSAAFSFLFDIRLVSGILAPKQVDCTWLAYTSHVALRTRNSGAESGGELFKGSKDAARLLPLHAKKLFGWGVRIVCEWRRKWRSFRRQWRTSTGPGLKLLGGSISLKLLLGSKQWRNWRVGRGGRGSGCPPWPVISKFLGPLSPHC